MQASLFEDASGGESIAEINRELLEKGKLRFPNRVFVLGTGPGNAEIVVVGESPGPPDVATGKPFTGPAGELLRKILAAIEIKSDDCYLTNAVKFISQGEEMTSDVLSFFTPYLHREISAIGPKLIILLGNTPARTLLGTRQPISKVRGEFADFQGIKAMPTFNPAYLLRDPTKKREVWDDMRKVRVFLDQS